MSDSGLLPPRVDLDLPRWDQRSYWGRARQFFTTTNTMNLFVSPAQLEAARDTVVRYRQGELGHLTEDEVWAAKHLYDSAFHPDTGEKMILPGRMSAQVPFNMLITGCMMTFYKTAPAVIFWQWGNQSFNALVNYTNRSGKTEIPMSTLSTSYVAATGSALATALGLNAVVKTLPPLVGRLVPFAAVAAGNSINIPLMRRTELTDGIMLETEAGERIGQSKIAARQGITMVVLSRVGMAMPGMVMIPLVMNSLEKRGTLQRIPWAAAPIQIGLLGLVLSLATPMCCAIFEQRASIKPTALEPELQEKIRGMANPPELLYYNKGL